MPRFVLLNHELPATHDRGSHIDVMFEQNGVLWTWAIDKWPGEAPVLATRLPDHRLAYLEYEGPVSNDRGSVSRLDYGEFEFVIPPTEQGDSLTLDVRLSGRTYSGLLCIFNDNGRQWLEFDGDD